MKRTEYWHSMQGKYPEVSTQHQGFLQRPTTLETVVTSSESSYTPPHRGTMSTHGLYGVGQAAHFYEHHKIRYRQDKRSEVVAPKNRFNSQHRRAKTWRDTTFFTYLYHSDRRNMDT